MCCRMITPVAGESGLYLLEAASPWGTVAAGHQEPSARDKAWRISRAGSREGDGVGGPESKLGDASRGPEMVHFLGEESSHR